MRTCNETQMELNVLLPSTHRFHIIQLIYVSVVFFVNMFLSIPLRVAIVVPPSLLCKPRFSLLFHLLCCNQAFLLAVLIQEVFFVNNASLSVAQCVVYCGVAQCLLVVGLFLQAALVVDCCVAINMPLHYQSLLSPRRMLLIQAFIWMASLLMLVGTMGLKLAHLRTNAPLPYCTPALINPCLTQEELMSRLSFGLSVLVLAVSLVAALGGLAVLCCHFPGKLCSQQRAGITLSLQAAQTILQGGSLVVISPMLSAQVQHQLELVMRIIYILSVSLVSLVYGFRSRELQSRMRKLLMRAVTCR